MHRSILTHLIIFLFYPVHCQTSQFKKVFTPETLQYVLLSTKYAQWTLFYLYLFTTCLCFVGYSEMIRKHVELTLNELCHSERILTNLNASDRPLSSHAQQTCL